MKYSRTNLPPKVISCPKIQREERQVFNNLAVTPSQMLTMAEKGLPISAQNLEFTPKDGTPNPSWDIPRDMVRGIDPATLWEENQHLKSKAIRAHKRDVAQFG